MVRACASCGKHNRIPAVHLADEGRCGACKAILPATSAPIDVNPQDFQEIVSKSRVPILIDFWAEWCAPCRMAAPEVKKVAETSAGKALVLKVNTEAHPELAQRFGVRGIPHFVVLKNGQNVAQHSGYVPAATMTSWLNLPQR